MYKQKTILFYSQKQKISCNNVENKSALKAIETEMTMSASEKLLYKVMG